MLDFIGGLHWAVRNMKQAKQNQNENTSLQRDLNQQPSAPKACALDLSAKLTVEELCVNVISEIRPATFGTKTCTLDHSTIPTGIIMSYV